MLRRLADRRGALHKVALMGGEKIQRRAKHFARPGPFAERFGVKACQREEPWAKPLVARDVRERLQRHEFGVFNR